MISSCKKYAMVIALIVAAICGYLSGKLVLGICTFAATCIPVVIWFVDDKENRRRAETINDLDKRLSFRDLGDNSKNSIAK